MEEQNGHSQLDDKHVTLPVSGMYEKWFLDYASYVILERAVPAIEDGLKPVQRRILHAMKEMDDGRFNKVANIIGSTMQYHPHGDASIGDSVVNMGQKDLLIETQGNWGDIRTGDGAAAPRYIEARLSKFALEVVFNPQTTHWQLSYDGRKKEPINLPMKFPMLLSQGTDGIAVGLATKILPHNFIELIEASIAVLKGQSFNLYPDFSTGGSVDVSNYNDGKRGGKIRVRAKIEVADNKTLSIKEIPFSTTTTSLIESIVKAADNGKIKIKKVIDNTAKDVEVEVQLVPGQSPDVAIAALYAFTDCEVSISPNACVIYNEKPKFLSVSEMLRISTEQTKELLKQELEILKSELQEKLLFASLEKIFIENRIYRKIEECETWEAVLTTIDKELDPYKPQFYRSITQDDIVKLTEIKIKRISKFDSFKADELMRSYENDLNETENHLNNLVAFAIGYFKNLLKKYGKGKERRTEIAVFDVIAATQVAANNTKLYVNREEGFIGFGLKKDEFVCDCSDIDEIIVFRKDGKFLVTKITEKSFVGKDIICIEVFNKNDDRRVYNMVFHDGGTGFARVKRFKIGGITRDKEYDLTVGEPNSKTLYLSSNPNGEAEVVSVYLSPNSKAKIKQFDYDFAELDIKNRSAQGNILAKYNVKKVVLKKQGSSTLSALPIYYDESVGMLNKEGRGSFVGKFEGNDRIICFYKTGEYELTNFELTNRYENKQLLFIEKFIENNTYTLIYFEGGSSVYYIKRFAIETTTLDKRFLVISSEKGSELHFVTSQESPVVDIHWKDKNKTAKKDKVELVHIAEVKGWKSVGNKLPIYKLEKIEWHKQDVVTQDEQNQLGLF